MSKLDYERDMQIDPDALDVEWLGQAGLALRYGRHVCELQRQVAQLRERVKTVRSELIRQANDAPEECCNKTRPNAADIEAYYRTQERYKQAVEEAQEAEYELAYAEVAKNEICYTRKAALENLVVLHGQQYFAGPKIPRNISKEWERRQREKAANTKVGRVMRRRKRKEASAEE